jgi:hypothetical protein
VAEAASFVLAPPAAHTVCTRRETAGGRGVRDGGRLEELWPLGSRGRSTHAEATHDEGRRPLLAVRRGTHLDLAPGRGGTNRGRIGGRGTRRVRSRGDGGRRLTATPFSGGPDVIRLDRPSGGTHPRLPLERDRSSESTRNPDPPQEQPPSMPIGRIPPSGRTQTTNAEPHSSHRAAAFVLVFVVMGGFLAGDPPKYVCYPRSDNDAVPPLELALCVSTPPGGAPPVERGRRGDHARRSGGEDRVRGDGNGDGRGCGFGFDGGRSTRSPLAPPRSRTEAGRRERGGVRSDGANGHPDRDREGDRRQARAMRRSRPVIRRTETATLYPYQCLAVRVRCQPRIKRSSCSGSWG